MRRLSILLALLGLALAAALVVRFDAGDIWQAMRSVGWHGAAILLLLQGALALLLGSAWATVQPDVRPPILIWGRMVRDAASACLPFSPVGGYVIGARAAALLGPDWTATAAGTVVDVSAEIAGELLFVLIGMVLLLALAPGAGVAWPIAAAVAVVLALALFGFSQRARIGGVVQALGLRLFGHFPRFVDNFGRTRDEINQLFGHRDRLLAGVGLHLLGWLGTGFLTWTSLRLLGHRTEFLGIVALEALLSATVSVAFVVPGAAGVQEAGYVGIGALFGVPPDLALSVSLLRRAREVFWGLPVLGVWQLQELRRA